jgi:hypothetical protein
MFKDAKTAAAYAFAGNAGITLRSTVTGAHFTFKVTSPRTNADNVLFVSVLVGADDYRYIGMLDASRTFRTTAKSQIARDAKATAAFRYFIAALAKGEIPSVLEVRHEGRCGACGRKITTPSSLDSGIGPECARQAGTPAPRLARKSACNHSRTTSPFHSSSCYGQRIIRQCTWCGDIAPNGVSFQKATPEMLAAIEQAAIAKDAWHHAYRTGTEEYRDRVMDELLDAIA